jgi:hypothetical protein
MSKLNLLTGEQKLKLRDNVIGTCASAPDAAIAVDSALRGIFGEEESDAMVEEVRKQLLDYSWDVLSDWQSSYDQNEYVDDYLEPLRRCLRDLDALDEMESELAHLGDLLTSRDDDDNEPPDDDLDAYREARIMDDEFTDSVRGIFDDVDE